MGAAGITSGLFADPIGTLQGLQASAQQVQSVAQQGLTELSFTSSIMNLPNADNSAGWTLGTYGGQTSLSLQSIEDYMLLRPPLNYTSALYQQTEVINQPGYYGSFATTSDPRLAAVVDEIRTALGNPANYAEGMGMDDITQAIYTRNQSIYSQPLSNPWVNNNLLHKEIRLAGSNPNLSPYGVTPLGDYFGTSPGCVGNVCYENSILAQAVASTYGQNTLIGTFFDDSVAPGLSGGHAVNLFLNDNGVLSVADPTWNVSGALENYVQYLQSFKEYDDIIWNTERIFIPKP